MLGAFAGDVLPMYPVYTVTGLSDTPLPLDTLLGQHAPTKRV